MARVVRALGLFRRRPPLTLLHQARAAAQARADAKQSAYAASRAAWRAAHPPAEREAGR